MCQITKDCETTVDGTRTSCPRRTIPRHNSSTGSPPSSWAIPTGISLPPPYGGDRTWDRTATNVTYTPLAASVTEP